MKKIILFFFVLLFIFSCKKETNKTNLKKENSQANLLSKKDKSFDGLGDILISQQDYINSIENTCPKDYAEDCSLKKLTFNPDVFQNKTLFINDNVSLKIDKRIEKNELTGTTNIKIQLISKSKKVLLYERFYEEYAVGFKTFYLDPNYNLWVLDYFIDDEGVFLNYWKKYKINTSSGEIVLVKELIKQRYGNNNTFETGSIVYAQVETYLNIRSAPSSSGAIIAKAYPKDGLKVLEVLEGWVKVDLNGTEGYVSSDFVK